METIQVLGDIRVECEGIDMTPAGRLPRRLLAALTACAPRGASAATLVEAAWGECPPPSAASALRTHLATARKAVGGNLTSTGGIYRLTRPESIDLIRYTDLVSQARTLAGSPAEQIRRLGEALDLWGGRPWGDLADDPWWSDQAYRLEERHRALVDEWIGLVQESGHAAQYAARVNELALAEPLREVRTLALMSLLHELGRSADALSAYQNHRLALVEELGVSPGAAVEALYDDIIAGERSRGVVARLQEQPAGPLIGRTTEIATAESLLSRHRLTTITGLGGMGKSRLASELATRARQRGIRVRTLASPGPGLEPRFVRELASQFGIHPPTEIDATEGLTDRLSDVDLLVLDGPDLHRARAIDLVLWLIDHRPRLTILATARLPFDVVGEAVLHLGPLEVPEEGEVTQGTAVELIAQAASRGADAPTSAELLAAARRTGGIPLLLELAARRPAALGELPSTIEGAVEDALGGLGPVPLELARTIAVLPDGLSPAFVERLCAQDPQVAWALKALGWAGITRLVRTRYSSRHDLLDPVREAIRAGADPTDEAQVWREFGGHLDALGAALRPSLHERPRYEVFDLLDQEGANVPGAILADGTDRLDLLVQLSAYLGCRGHSASCAEWLAEDLHSEDPRRAAFAALASSQIGRFSGTGVPLLDELDRAVTWFREAGDDPRTVSCSLALVIARCYNADVPGARAALDSIDAEVARANTWERAIVGVGRGFVSLLEWDWTGAIGHLSAAESTFADEGDVAGLAMSLYVRSILSLVSEDESQEELVRRARHYAEGIGDLPMIGLCRYAEIGLGSVGKGSTRPYLAAAEALDAGGLTDWAAQARMGAAAILIESDRPAEAASHILAAVGPLSRASVGGLAYALGGLAASLRDLDPELGAEIAWWAGRPIDPGSGVASTELLAKRDRWLGYAENVRNSKRGVDELLILAAERLAGA